MGRYKVMPRIAVFAAMFSALFFASTTSAAAQCDLSGTWKMVVDNIATTSWSFTATGGGQYRAAESGAGNATGTASVSGNQMVLDWKTANGYSGRHNLALDPNCARAEGSLTVYTGNPGTYGSHWQRLSGPTGGGGGGGGGSYSWPQTNGTYVDWCATFANNCGQGGADQFCRTQGYSRAASWSWGYVDRTWVIGSSQYCESRGQCGALKDVVCAAGGSGQMSYPLPQLNGAYVDWCATFAASCGQGGADQFCRTQGYARASSWSWGYTDRTYVIGSNQFCEARGQCGALKDVICSQ